MTTAALESKLRAAHARGDTRTADRLRKERMRPYIASQHSYIDARGHRITSTTYRDNVPIRVAPVLGTALLGFARTPARRPARHTRTVAPVARKASPAHVFMSRFVREQIMRSWDFLDERVASLFGVRDGDTLYVESAVDVTLESYSASCIGSRARIEQARDREAGCGPILLGDLHVHPAAVGPVADPSNVDLRGWLRGLKHEGNGFYVGVVLQRTHGDVAAWLSPVWTACVVTRDAAGEPDARLCDVEHEPSEFAKRFAMTSTTNGGTRSWRL